MRGVPPIQESPCWSRVGQLCHQVLCATPGAQFHSSALRPAAGSSGQGGPARPSLAVAYLPFRSGSPIPHPAAASSSFSSFCFSEARPPSQLLARLIPAQPSGLRTDGQDKSPSWELVPVLIFTIFSALLRVTQSLSPLVSCSRSSLPLSPLPPFFTHSTSLAFCSELLKQFPCPFVGRVPFPVLRCRYRVRRGPSPPDPAYAVPLPASRREGMHT